MTTEATLIVYSIRLKGASQVYRLGEYKDITQAMQAATSQYNNGWAEIYGAYCSFANNN